MIDFYDLKSYCQFGVELIHLELSSNQMGLRDSVKLWWLKRRMFSIRAGTECLERMANYKIRRTDGPSFYITYKDEFIRRIYDFECSRPDPNIVDGGSHIGMSILYFKRRYPQARITGFEPDPDIYRLLKQNIENNGLSDVQLINAGLGNQAGFASFAADGSQGGMLSESGSFQVRVEALSAYLQQPVDFLKLNIEGQEYAVLHEVEAKGLLPQIKQMVIEYHGWANGPQYLGPILTLLDQAGFRYLIHDFDSETSSASKPPFRLNANKNWFCLIYAAQR